MMADWTPPDTDPDAPATAWAPPDTDPEVRSAAEQKLHDLGGDAWGDDALTQNLHAMASGMYHGAVGGFKGLGYLLAAKGNDAATDAVNEETAKAYQAPDSATKRVIESPWNPLNWAQNSADYLADKSAEHGASPGVSTAIKTIPTAAAALTGTAGLMRGSRAAAATSAADAAAAPKQIGSSQSISAARTLPDLTGTTPELQQAVQAHQGPMNMDALERQRNAETLPLPEGESAPRLTKGQASRDEQQIADEFNMRDDPDTQKLIRSQISDQSKKLGMSIGEIQRRAAPDLVQRTTADHGQAAIDAIKAQDNATVTDIRAKYKELADQNGGDMPIDAAKAVNDIVPTLKKKSLRNVVAQHPYMSEIMDTLRNGDPIDFETFEDWRSGLARIQRGANGEQATAAGVIHNTLNNIPLTEKAAPLRALADTARKAAKDRFDTIEQNPAYKAAIEDNTPMDPETRLHVIGAPSPQAGSFLHRFATGDLDTASPALVARLKEAVPSADLHSAIEGATLNKLRDAAGIDALGEGTFKSAAFSKTVGKLGDKAPLLLKPDTLKNVSRLKRFADDVAWEGAASGKNRSNTGSALARFGALPTAVPDTGVPSIGSALAHTAAGAVAHTIPHGGLIHRAGDLLLSRRREAQGKAAQAKAEQSMRDAKLKFAQDATRPGAGIEVVPEDARQPRAAGGRAAPTDDELVNRLISRWHAAKRATERESKPLLSMPDEAIVHALKISGRSL